MQRGASRFEWLAAVTVAASVFAANGCSSTGEPGTLTALDNRDGSPAWHSEVESSPTQVLVIGANDAGPYPRDPAEIVSLDPDTGETRWVTSLDGAGQIVDVAIADDLAIVRTTATSTDDAYATVVQGVSLSGGRIRWRHDLGISEVLKPLLVSTDNVVVDLLTWGWSDERTDTVEGRGSSLSGDSLAGRLGSDLVVWNAQTGEKVWSVAHPGGMMPGGGAWIAGGRVLSATPALTDTDQARLGASALSLGVEQWSEQLPGDVAVAASTDEMSWVASWGRGGSCD